MSLPSIQAGLVLINVNLDSPLQHNGDLLRVFYLVLTMEGSGLVASGSLISWDLTVGVATPWGCSCICLGVIYGLSLWRSHAIYAVSHITDVVFLFVTQPTMEIELVNKKLTTTDIRSCLSYPTGNLWAFQMVQGENAISLTARDPTGRVWEFMLSTRNHGRHKKPVIGGGWLKYVREKGLTVNDSIILTMVADAENGVSYNIRVEPNLELVI
ncbi:hypothetical protein POTOM_053897 [Populus tomentosa]|uniref:TF-B3 domain-containing protein n=1 Tax=Populus tomentosa TaxID=118781 RepID=A0A8X7Y6L2_POPTO|nr:hypothetical protein POTOM_053897 [Populus tomentosa]